MHSSRAVAFIAILLLPVVTHARAGRPTQGAAQPAASYTYQGTVRAFKAKTGSLDLITGVGMALRIVHVTVAPAAHAAGGAAARLAGLEFKPGDIVRVECHRTDTGLVADRIERVEVPKP
jgi:hypothetical protein